MNLHTLTPETYTQWIWVSVNGGNGRNLGVHLYELEQGTPPDLEEDDPERTRLNPFYCPRRFNWHAYRLALNNLGARGYTVPLCGQRSRSRQPYYNFSRGTGCGNCMRTSIQRGIMGTTGLEAEQTSTMQQAITQEYREWTTQRLPTAAQRFTQMTQVPFTTTTTIATR